MTDPPEKLKLDFGVINLFIDDYDEPIEVRNEEFKGEVRDVTKNAIGTVKYTWGNRVLSFAGKYIEYKGADVD